MGYIGGESDGSEEQKTNDRAEPSTPFRIGPFAESVLGVIASIAALLLLPFIVSFPLIIAGICYWKWSAARRSISAAKQSADERRARLIAAHGVQVADAIIGGMVWTGQSSDQVRESVGQPCAIDSTTTERSRTEVWKYGHRGGSRYTGRITLVDGAVTKWTIKQ